MSTHRFEARLVWTGAALGPTRDYESYSREWRVDIAGKPPLAGSAAVPFRGAADLHNPEDLLVAALASCHCLSYLALCARAGVLVVSYEDSATGTMAFDRTAKAMKFTEVTLRPIVRVASGSDLEAARRLHERAHHECFIASSVNFPVKNEPSVSS